MPETPTRKAVLLDRDGTLIVDKIYLNDPDAIEYLPGVFTALRELRDAGFVFAVLTNQSGVARGLVDVRNLDEIHRRIRAEFARQGIDFLSFHSAPFMTNWDHPLRKPNPGMLLEAVRWHALDPARSWMVGDKITDVQAGHKAGMKSVFLTPEPGTAEAAEAEIAVPSLLDAVHLILSWK